MWLAENEPESMSRAAYMVQSKDYLAGRLTGAVGTTDPSDASLTGAFDVGRRAWVRELWTEAGLPERLLPKVRPSTQIVGTVTSNAAAQLGLRPGIPVVAGGGDGPCATAGSGVAPGGAYHYVGSSSWIGLNADAPVADDRLSHYCSLDERVTVFGTVQSAGTSLEWFSSVFGHAGESHADLDRAAFAVPPGASDLFFLPYLQGERAPLWDALARGVFFGLTPSHGRAEMYRAVLEGVGYALRSILDVYAENGHPLTTLRQLGGGGKSAVWRSILAAIFEREILSVAGVSSATCLGAAMAAGVGVGIYPSIAEAGRRLTSIEQQTSPDPDLVAAYRPRMAFYRTLYPALRDRFEGLAALGG
jgi:xylulokinase